MPIYPLTLPAAPRPNQITWRQVSKVAVSQSPFTGQEHVYVHPGQWWEISFDLPPLNAAQAAEWAGKLISLNGRQGTFKFAPTDASPIAAVSGTLLVDAISDNFIDLSGMTGKLSAGDWIQIESGLYRVTQGDTAVAGVATIEIWPTPRAEIVAATSTVEYTAPVGIFRMFDAFEWDMDVAKLYGISIGAKEVI
jgi:hypothetical protein